MVKDAEVGVNDRQAVFAYGMSKMTVKNEMDNGLTSYKKMVFVEFLEFIGRIANERYKSYSEPLAMKIEKVLDKLLAVVGYSRRKVESGGEMSEGESEDSGEGEFDWERPGSSD